MNIFNNAMYLLNDEVSRSISAENFTGEKGKGGMATEGAMSGPARELGKGWKVSPAINIAPHETVTIADVDGEGAIRHIWMTDTGTINRSLILRIYWDNNETPSIETPLCDFFAMADYQNGRQLRSLMTCVNSVKGFNSYFEMPFRKHFKITVENITDQTVLYFFQIDYALYHLPENAGYLHAQFRRVNPLPYKEVYTILDGVHGKGKYVGTYLFWGTNNNGWWGEGEIKFYLDGDREYPTICGTGTEDYFCGAWCFCNEKKDTQYTTFSSPYSGFDVSATDDLFRSNRRFSLYRWHITDPICFDEDIRVTIQALGWRSEGRFLPLQDDISSVAFWYSDRLDDVYPPLPDKDHLEII